MDTKKIKIDTLLLTTLVFLVTVMSDRYLHSIYQSIHIPKFAGVGITRTIGISIIALLLIHFQKPLVTTELSKATAVNGLKKGLFWSAGFGVVALCGFFVLHLAGINPFKLFHARLPERHTDVLFLFITGGVIAPIAEELFFRGVLFNFLRQYGIILANEIFTWGIMYRYRKQCGIAMAVFVSTTIFVLFHLLGTGIFIPQIVGGLVFTISYEMEKSLLVPIIIHSTGNIALFTISLI